MKTSITVTLSLTQARVIASALDLYARVLIGQLENVEEVIRMTYPKVPLEKLYEARELLNRVKRVVWGFPPNGSHGIHNAEVSDRARQAFDLEQVIKTALFEASPPASFYGYPQKPSQTSTVEPLAEAKVGG